MKKKKETTKNNISINKKKVSQKRNQDITSFSSLKDSIDQLEDRIDKANSTRRIFWKGVLTGLGGAIGATIIFAILISIISWIIAETEATWLQNLIESFGIDKAVNK